MKVHGRQSIASLMKLILDVTWWAAAVSLGLLVVVLVCSTFLELSGDNLTLSLPVAVKFETPIHSLDGQTEAHFEKLRGNLRFPARNGVFLSGSVAVVVLIFGYLLWIVTQLREVFRSVSQGLPFVSANARRIRGVGLAVIIGEGVRAAIVYFWSYYASLNFTAHGLHFSTSLDLNPTTFVGGLALLVIAEVFQQGTQLREDQSLTI